MAGCPLFYPAARMDSRCAPQRICDRHPSNQFPHLYIELLTKYQVLEREITMRLECWWRALKDRDGEAEKLRCGTSFRVLRQKLFHLLYL
jgi:hypothetical protein